MNGEAPEAVTEDPGTYGRRDRDVFHRGYKLGQRDLLAAQDHLAELDAEQAEAAAAERRALRRVALRSTVLYAAAYALGWLLADAIDHRGTS